MTIRFVGSTMSNGTLAPRQPQAGAAPGRLPPPQPAYDEPPAAPRVDWSAYWRSIRKRRWAIATIGAIATVGALIYAQSIQPIYHSTTTLLIEAGKAKILSIEEVYNAVSQDREYYQTQVEILRSHDVALRTVMATKLWDEPEFDPRKSVRSWQGRIKDLISPPAELLPWTPERLAESAVARYLGAVSIEPVRLSQLVKISFDAADPVLAAKVADATAVAYIDTDRDARLKLNLSVNGLLQDRMVALRSKLKQSEDDLQRFREQSGLVNVGGSQGIAAQQMAEIGQRLIAARVRRTELESAYQQVAAAGDGEVPASTAIAHPGLGEARSRVSAASLHLEEVSRTLGDQHARVIEARTALAAAQKDLAAQSRAAVAALRREAAAARETERSLQAGLASARGAVQDVNRQEFQLGVLEREVQANRQLYELFLSRAKETSVSNNLQSAVARIVDPARPATAPLKPNKPQIVMVALMAALLLGSAGAIGLDRTAETIGDSDDAESRLQLPVLAALPEPPPPDIDGADSTFLNAPRSHHANAIRRARTNIVLADMLVTHKVMLVTSSVGGEGKTSFCADLAYALAQAKRTLLIDCNLRDPQVGMRMALPLDAKGICELGTGAAEAKDCVHSVPGSTLLVMPSGVDVPEHPEELLLSPQFRATLRSLASRVDIVLIDTPPLAAGSDALILSQMADDIVYVVKARETPLDRVHKGLEQLQRAGANVLGLVLTNTEAEGAAAPLRPAWRARQGRREAPSTVVES